MNKGHIFLAICLIAIIFIKLASTIIQKERARNITYIAIFVATLISGAILIFN